MILSILFGNPILQRELRLLSRNPRLNIALGLVAAVAGGLALLVLAVASGGVTGGGLPTQTGVQLFSLLALGQLLLLILLAPGLTSGAISSERERRTLEPLWQSGLAASSLVVGKWLGALALLALLLLVTVPAMAMLLLLGGVPLRLLGLVYAVLAGTGMLLTALGLCASAFSQRTQAAATAAYVITSLVVALSAVPSWVAGDALTTWGVKPQIFAYQAMTNPLAALAATTGGPFFTPIMTATLGPSMQAGRSGSSGQASTQSAITGATGSAWVPSAYATLAGGGTATVRGTALAMPAVTYGYLIFSGGTALLLLVLSAFAVRPPMGWGLGAILGLRRRRNQPRTYDSEGGVSNG